MDTYSWLPVVFVSGQWEIIIYLCSEIEAVEFFPRICKYTGIDSTHARMLTGFCGNKGINCSCF